MLMRMPLLSTSPISNPMVKLMNSSAISPATVVIALDAMGMKEFASASVMASCGGMPASRYAL